jgi:uncharacterized protein (DUF2336 family)
MSHIAATEPQGPTGEAIIDRFLMWAQGAPAGARAEGVGTLARAFLHSEMTDGAHAAAEAALTLFLDDPATDVRRVIAEVFARSPTAPRHIVFSLAHDVTEVALPVLLFSPRLTDPDLSALLGIRGEKEQSAIAARARISGGLAREIAGRCSATACTILARNPDTRLREGVLDMLIQRHGESDAVRAALLDREDLSVAGRHQLVRALSERLGGLAVQCFAMTDDRARHMVHENTELAALQIADAAPDETGDMMAYLRSSGQLSAGLILQALAAGRMSFVETAFGELTGLGIERVRRLMSEPETAGFRALHRDAGFPRSSLAVFQKAMLAWAEAREQNSSDAEARQHVAEEALASSAPSSSTYRLFNRLAADAARDRARERLDARKRLAA